MKVILDNCVPGGFASIVIVVVRLCLGKRSATIIALRVLYSDDDRRASARGRNIEVSPLIAWCAFAGRLEPASHVAATKTGTVFSTDRRYSATGALGEAEVVYLTVRQGKRAVLHITDARGFAWLAGKTDTLIYSTSGLYGSGGLWIWNPDRGSRPIVKVKRRRDETFVLDRIDLGHGRPVAVYRHGDAEQPDSRLRVERKLVGDEL